MSNPKRQRESRTTGSDDSLLRHEEQIQHRSVSSADGQSSIGFRSTKSYQPPVYEDLAQSSDLFWEKLHSFHNSLGTKLK